jgi:hypothetical protein
MMVLARTCAEGGIASSALYLRMMMQQQDDECKKCSISHIVSRRDKERQDKTRHDKTQRGKVRQGEARTAGPRWPSTDLSCRLLGLLRSRALLAAKRNATQPSTPQQSRAQHSTPQQSRAEQSAAQHFELSFPSRNDQFTKTGSEQTYRKG